MTWRPYASRSFFTFGGYRLHLLGYPGIRSPTVVGIEVVEAEHAVATERMRAPEEEPELEAGAAKRLKEWESNDG